MKFPLLNQVHTQAAIPLAILFQGIQSNYLAVKMHPRESPLKVQFSLLHSLACFTFVTEDQSPLRNQEGTLMIRLQNQFYVTAFQKGPQELT